MSYIPALPAEVADSVDVLISAISSSDEQAQLDALGHLASLIDETEGALASALGEHLREGGAVRHVLRLLEHRNQNMHQLALLVLGNLSSDAVDEHSWKTKSLVKRYNGFDRVLPYIWHSDETALLYALGCVQNLCTDPDYVAVMRARGAEARLTQLTQTMEASDVANYAAGCLKNMSEATTAGKVASLWQQVSFKPQFAAARIQRAWRRTLLFRATGGASAAPTGWFGYGQPRKAAPAPAAAAPRRAWFGGGAPAPAPAAAAAPKPPGPPMSEVARKAFDRCVAAVKPRAAGAADACAACLSGIKCDPLSWLAIFDGSDEAKAASGPGADPRLRAALEGGAPLRALTSRKAAAACAGYVAATALLLALLLGAAPPPLAEMELSLSQCDTHADAWSSRCAGVDVADGGALVELDGVGVEQRWFWLNLELYHRGAAPFHAAATALRVSVESRASPGDPWHPYASGSATRALTCAVDAWCDPLPLIAVSGLHARYWRVGVELLETGSQMSARAAADEHDDGAGTVGGLGDDALGEAKLELLVGTASFGAYAVAVRAAVCVVAIALALLLLVRYEPAGADGASSGADGVQLTPRVSLAPLGEAREAAHVALLVAALLLLLLGSPLAWWVVHGSAALRAAEPLVAAALVATLAAAAALSLASARRGAVGAKELPLGALYVAAAAWGAYKLDASLAAHAHHLELPVHTALHLPLLLVALGAAALWAAQLRSLLRWVARQPGGRAQLALVGAVLGASLVAEVAWVPVQEQQLSTAGGDTLGAAERYGVARLAVHAADAALLAYLLMPTPGKAIVKFGAVPNGRGAALL